MCLHCAFEKVRLYQPLQWSLPFDTIMFANPSFLPCFDKQFGSGKIERVEEKTRGRTSEMESP